jgi:hypothetical protein
MGVGHARVEEEVEQASQERVADVAVKPRHGARMDVLHAVAHHQVGALVEELHEARDLAEVVREVGVGHDDVMALRHAEPGQVGASVAAAGLVDHARAGACRDRAAAVPRPVVHHDHLAVEAARVQRGASAPNALADVLCLVEAGQHD